MFENLPEIPGIRTLSFSKENAEISVGENETAVAFIVPEKNVSMDVRADVAAGGRLFVRAFASPGTAVRLETSVLGERASVNIQAAVLSDAGHPASFSSETRCLASHVEALTYVAAFVLPDGDVSVRTGAAIDPGVSEVSAEARQRHLFFGESGKIRSVPGLRVASDDVTARHSASVERFSGEQLFFLRARWLSEENATLSLLSGRVSEIFSGLPKGFEDVSKTLCSGVLHEIVKK